MSVLWLVLGCVLTTQLGMAAAIPSGTLIPAPGSPFAAGTSPGSLAVGDFNRDGRLDLAVVSRDPFHGTVTVLLGNERGGFTSVAGGPFAVGDAPWAFAVGDFNGDGKLDMAVANYNSNDVSVLLGDGHGGFFAMQGSPFPMPAARRPVSLAVGDFNGDGRLDLVVGELFGGVTVFLGAASGGFTAAIGSPFFAGNGPASLAVADLNGDGKLDLVVANVYGKPIVYQGPALYEPGNTITVLLGNGSGGFTPAVGSPFRTGVEPVSVAIGDFNRDGRPDLAIAASTDNNVTVLLGNGSGGFTPAAGTPLSVGVHPTSMAVGDFNGDGIPDLTITGGDSYDLSVLLGNGSGGFVPAAGRPFLVGGAPFSVAVGDFNGDGRLDVAVANISSSSVSVLLGASASTATTLTTTGPNPIVAGQRVFLRTQVSAIGTYFNPPKGTVTIRDGVAALATVALADNVAILELNGLAVGSHSLTAVYNGDTSTLASTSDILVVKVTAQPPPPIQISGITNGASFEAGVAAPNTILALFGSNLSCTPKPQVLVDGVSAEVLGSTSTQINFAVPPSVGMGTVSVQVVCGTNQSQPYRMPAADLAPGIFTASSTGLGQGSILNQDASVNQAASPAVRGSYISAFVTGFGRWGAPDADGLQWLLFPVTAFVGDAQADVQYAGTAPGYTAGLQQINLRIPTDAPIGSGVKIRLVINGVSTQTGVMVAVKP